MSFSLEKIFKSNHEGGFEVEGVRKSVIVNLFGLIGICFCITYGIHNYFIQNYLYSIVVLSFALLTFSDLFFLHITKKYEVASIILVIVMFTMEIFFFITGGEGNSTFLWYYVFPILSLFTLGRLKGSIFIVLLFIITALLVILKPSFCAVYEKPIILRLFSSLFAVSAMSFVFEYVREQTYKALQIVDERKTFYLTQLQQQQEEIVAQSNELEKINHTLEERVQEELNKNREKEMMLIQQSRHAAMGEMIGNIAHQWRQPLNAVGIIIQNFREAYEFGELDEKYIEAKTEKAMDLIKYMSQTIDDFRNFFKPDKAIQKFSINDAIKKSFSFLEATFKNSNIKITSQIDENLYMMGYPNEYAQVIINILSNAKDVINERKITQGEVVVKLVKVDNKARLIISDNAGGIPEEIINKIFDPYFTTKDKDKGTGLGLYMAKTIIEKNMNGTLTANNSPLGAEFIIETDIVLE